MLEFDFVAGVIGEESFELGLGEELGAVDVVDGGSAGVMDAPGFFTHGDDTAAGGFSGGEVDVGELGEGVADGVVDGALRDFAAFNVSDGDAEGEGDGGWGEHLIAVGNEEEEVRTPGGECVGQAEGGEADGLGHAGVGIGAEEALYAGDDGETVAFDFTDGVAEFGRVMGAEGEEAEVDCGVGGEFTEGPEEVAVIGAGGGDDGDAAFFFCVFGGLSAGGAEALGPLAQAVEEFSCAGYFEVFHLTSLHGVSINWRHCGQE